MADKVPVKGGYNGGSLTGIAEYATGDTLGVAHGGTGVVTIGSNQLLTGNGTSALTSESNLTFDGTILKATGDLCATVKVVSPALCIGSEYVLPTADGSAGQIMCTNGSGALAFATATAGVTLAGSTNNTIATVTGADALCGEGNLTYDGSTLNVGGAALVDSGATRVISEFTSSNTNGMIVVSADTETLNDTAGIAFNATASSALGSTHSIGNIEGKVVQAGTLKGDLVFHTNSGDSLTEKMRIDSAGNVIIGGTTTTTNWTAEGKLFIEAAIPGIGLRDTTGSADDWMIVNSNGTLTIANDTDNTQPVVVTDAGKVGIGTATPGTLLHAEGTSGYMKFDPSGSDAALKLISTSGNTNFGTYNGSHLNFFTNSLKRMYISSGGQPRINTTDDYAQLEIGSSDGNGAIRTLQSGNATVATLYGWCTNYAGVVQQNIVGVNYSSSAFTYQGYDYQGSNLHMKIRSDGQAYIDQTWNNGGADYAEYWESTDGTRLDVGKTVVLDGNKVRYYNAEIDTVDDIFGVTRPKGDEGGSSGVVGNSAWSNWNGKHKVDDFGRWIKGERVRLEWDDPDNPDDSKYASEGKYSYYEDEVPEGVTPPEDAVRTVEYVRIINDDFDPSLEYVAREERDEWNVVGLIGQIPIIATETVNPKWKKQRAISDATDEYYVG